MGGCASSDWSPGPMLMCVHLGDICVVIGLSLMFLVFFVYVLIRKVGHICFITTMPSIYIFTLDIIYMFLYILLNE